MSWLTALLPGKWFVYAVAAGVIFTAGGTAAYKFQGMRLDKVKAEYAGFVATVKAQGEAAQAIANERIRLDNAAKRRADDENKIATDKLHADIKRMRNARSGSDYLPTPAPGAASPDTACFNRPQLERAMGKLDLGVQKIVDTGSQAVIDLDTAKRWAKPK